MARPAARTDKLRSPIMDSIVLGLCLTPHGRLAVSRDAVAPSFEANLTDRLRKAFEH